MPREALDGPGSELDANMENLSGQDKRIPYGPRWFELEKEAEKLKIEGFGDMTRSELMVAIDSVPKKKAKK